MAHTRTGTILAFWAMAAWAGARMLRTLGGPGAQGRGPRPDPGLGLDIGPRLGRREPPKCHPHTLILASLLQHTLQGWALPLAAPQLLRSKLERMLMSLQ